MKFYVRDVLKLSVTLVVLAMAACGSTSSDIPATTASETSSGSASTSGGTDSTSTTSGGTDTSSTSGGTTGSTTTEAWATSYGALSYWSFDNSTTMPYATESITSKTDWSAGSISFSISGLDYDSISDDDKVENNYWLFWAELYAPNGKSATFIYGLAAGTSRLISQRFDGTCSPFCENQNLSTIHWDPAETYSFLFTWDASNVSVVVKNSAGDTLHSGTVSTDGVYSAVNYIRVGNQVRAGYKGTAGAVTVINPVLN